MALSTTPLPPPDGGLYTTLAHAPGRLLILDYDGTLAPFVEDRFQAKPYPGVPERLARILVQPRDRVVIVTGRPVAELLPLLDMDPPPEIWGAHGWEHMAEPGRIEHFPLPEPLQETMREAKRRILRSVPADKLDQKAGSLAVHWRGLPESSREERERLARETWEPLVRPGLSLKPFDGGLELRVEGRDKGTAVHAILEPLPKAYTAVYLGDDLTDEDAFRALDGRGTGILVRTEYRPTHARWWLRPPEQLLEFLDRWSELDSNRT